MPFLWDSHRNPGSYMQGCGWYLRLQTCCGLALQPLSSSFVICSSKLVLSWVFLLYRAFRAAPALMGSGSSSLDALLHQCRGVSGRVHVSGRSSGSALGWCHLQRVNPGLRYWLLSEPQPPEKVWRGLGSLASGSRVLMSVSQDALEF